MSNAVRIAVMVLAVFALVPGIAGAADVTVKLAPQNNSGESGTATLSDAGAGKTKVTVNVTGQPAGNQPKAHPTPQAARARRVTRPHRTPQSGRPPVAQPPSPAQYISSPLRADTRRPKLPSVTDDPTSPHLPR